MRFLYLHPERMENIDSSLQLNKALGQCLHLPDREHRRSSWHDAQRERLLKAW